MIHHRYLLTGVCSCAEWDDLRKTPRSKRIARTDVEGTLGHKGHGEARHEGRQV